MHRISVEQLNAPKDPRASSLETRRSLAVEHRAGDLLPNQVQSRPCAVTSGYSRASLPPTQLEVLAWSVNPPTLSCHLVNPNRQGSWRGTTHFQWEISLCLSLYFFREVSPPPYLVMWC